MSNPSIPPSMMLRSFFTVASGYVLTWIVFFSFLFGFGYLFFPQFVEFVQLDEAAQKTLMAENPSAAIPVTMFVLMVVANAVACLGVGWLVARTAPFSHFSHGVFLAVMLFVMYLQIVIADPPAKKWMDVIYMGVLPVAILQGAKWGSRKVEAPSEN